MITELERLGEPNVFRFHTPYLLHPSLRWGGTNSVISRRLRRFGLVRARLWVVPSRVLTVREDLRRSDPRVGWLSDQTPASGPNLKWKDLR